MSSRPIKIQTTVKEIYFKLPSFNYVDEIIFSSAVPEKSLRKIVEKFNKNGMTVELLKFDGRHIMVKRNNNNTKFDTYFLNF